MRSLSHDETQPSGPGDQPAPERRLTTSEQIAEKLCDLIVRREISPGERIHEQDLSEMFGVSRGPIRDALRILERDGFVSITPFRGATVAAVSDTEFLAALEMQVALFAVAARLAALNITAEQLARLERLSSSLARMAERDDVKPDEFTDLSLQATYAIIDAACSQHLSHSLRGLRRLTRPGQWKLGLATKRKRVRAAANWARLVAAIHAHDPDKAEVAARARVRQIHASQIAAAQKALRRSA